MKETKNARFRRVAEARVNKIIRMLRLLGNCSGTNTYAYDADAVEQIFTALQIELDQARKRFSENGRTGRNRFSLSQAPTPDTVSYPHITLPLPDGTHLRAVAYADTTYPAINLYLLRDGEPEELVCFAEYNSEHNPCHELCIGVYTSDAEDTQYYPDMAKATESMAILCDNAYRRIKDDTCPAHINITVDKSGNLMRVSQGQLDSGSFVPTSVTAGEFTIFAKTGPAVIKKAGVVVEHTDFVGKYPLTPGRTLSALELSLIPKLPEWYIIPPEVVDICKHAQKTTGRPMQMRNFLLRGPAGTGKTMGAKAIAAGLGLPYMKYTCSANTEIFDFTGMIFPETDAVSTGSPELDREREILKSMGGISYANVAKLMRLPDLDDMDYDPAGVYQALTGVENLAATVQDCMSVVLEKVTEKVQALSKRAENRQSSGQNYTYVETDFVKALKHGYLVEVQEPSTIIQPGVLVGLNSLLEQEGSITLPTGEIIRRHPDTVVIVTTNVSYEGCRQMNQSVVDRMSLVKDIELPEPEVMVQRAMAVTGCADEYLVSQMVQVVNDMADYCRKNSITDGACGMRSLIDWVISAEISGDPYLSAKYTVISKATADEEDREALITTILDPMFAPKRKRTSA